MEFVVWLRAGQQWAGCESCSRMSSEVDHESISTEEWVSRSKPDILSVEGAKIPEYSAKAEGSSHTSFRLVYSCLLLECQWGEGKTEIQLALEIWNKALCSHFKKSDKARNQRVVVRRKNVWRQGSEEKECVKTSFLWWMKDRIVGTPTCKALLSQHKGTPWIVLRSSDALSWSQSLTPHPCLYIIAFMCPNFA